MGFLELLGRVFFLLLPVILGGVLNMIFVKLPLLKLLRVPMDGGKTLKDGRRVFGDNKTWKGFLGMIVLTTLTAWLFWHREFSFSWLRGAWIGFAYVLAELPNSFIKRRLNIDAGKNGGFLQTFFDQADSVIGCVLCLPIFYPLTWREALGIFVIATGTHYIINVLLFHLKLKNQKG